jgi:hypothetical protein
VTNEVQLSISETWMAIVFIGSVAGLFLLARFVGKPRRAVRVSLSEEGVSYSLSFVLVTPIIMFFCVLVVETVLIHMARIGVSYAAYAGARSAAVWISAKPLDVRRERITQSVYTALAPFTFNRLDPKLDADSLPTELAGKTSIDFAKAYGVLTFESDDKRTVTVGDMTKRYLYASGRMGMKTLDKDGIISLKLHYKYRCLFGFAGRILDKDHTSPFVIEMDSECKLPTERPGRTNGDLGIDYHSEPTSKGPGPKIDQFDDADVKQQ